VRQVVLVVVLVAASFLGGAFVNGPGLRWVQTQLLGSLGLTEGGEIASIDLKDVENPKLDGDVGRARPAQPGAEATHRALAPVSSSIAEAETGNWDAPDHRQARSARSGGTRDPKSPVSAPSPLSSSASPFSSPPPPVAAPVASSRAAAHSTPADPPPGVTAPGMSALALVPAPLDPSVPLGAGTPPGNSTSAPARADQNVAPAILDSLASLMPRGAPPTPTGSPSAPSSVPRSADPPQQPVGSKPAPGSGDEWAILARKMQALGISRFTIEGQPGGRVVFSCLIPVAGRQAVAERIEAEGEDGLRAVQAGLRRVALWRAAQR
jgi:hypothetical protein